MLIFKNIQAYIRTFGIIIPITILIKLNSNLIYLPLLYYIFILIFLINILLKNKITKQNTANIKYESLIKDKEFILFKNNLFNIYYTSTIILFYFLLKNNFYFLILNFYFFTLIFLIYSVLLNNCFILKLFNFFLILKKNIDLFNNTDWASSSVPFSFLTNKAKFNDSGVSNINQKVRYYSTSFTNNSQIPNSIDLKESKQIYKGGYLGYQNVISFGDVTHLNMAGTNADDRQDIYKYQLELENKINDYLNDIPDNITYTILPVIRSQYPNDEYKTVTITKKSIKITRDTSRKLLTKKIIRDVLKAVFIYDLKGTGMVLYVLGRPWLSDKDFNTDLSKVTEVLNNKIEKEITSWSKLSELNNSDKETWLKNYKYKNNFMDNYGTSVYDKNNNLIGYKLNEFEYASIKTYYNENNLLCNKVEIRDFNMETLSFENVQSEALITWIDIKTDLGFIRELDNSKYYYDKNNNLINVEVKYNQPKFPLYKLDSSLNSKIGVIDLETYGTDLGLGLHRVYAAGFAVNSQTELFYIENLESSEQFVNRFFWNILMCHDFNGYTFYIHNLGRFDSIFIIKSLVLNKEIKLTPVWKDNSILSLEIKHLNNKIILLDSYQLIPDNLESILKSFQCKTQKGQFPYNFVNKNNLFYKGTKPSKELYKNISDKDYLAIPDINWNVKTETLKYLKSDVEGLLEAVLKFRNSIHNKYNLNITKFKTLPGLALSVYTSKYMPNNLKSQFRMIKGGLENKIRESYFGGNVGVYINKVSNGYYYDMNSQYPKAMLNDMPIGNPTLSLEKDLNKIFGFVYGEITCPSRLELETPFIQSRNPMFNLVQCPRGSFKRLIFSEEIKYALKYGYKFNLEYSYVFERGKNLFTDYVKDHYEIKKSSKDHVQKNIAKLFLNSLYGRLGMNEIIEKMEIVDKEKKESLDVSHNVSIVSELTENKYLVKYNGKISEVIKDLYVKNIPDLNLSKKTKVKDLELNKTKTVSSAVHIASAISSYARILINEYKNIPGNPCVMSDTDSVVLTKPLPDSLVGDKLGQMKLVYEINSGIFLRKKFYSILDKNNKEIIKSSGVNPNKLNYSLFEKLLKGESIEIKETNFNVNWKTLKIKVVETKTKIEGLYGKILTIYNTTDVNYKFISFPVRYEIIIHPLYPLLLNHSTETKNTTDNLDSQTATNISLQKESDIFLLFSKSEIILFFIFITIFIAFITIYIIFIKKD